MENTGDTKLTAIDRALVAAKARKGTGGGAADEKEPHAKEPVAKAETHPDFAKAQKTAALKEAREAARVKRAADREARGSAKGPAPDGRPTHMKKVDRARSKCPPLSSPAEALFDEATKNLSLPQLDALSQHLAVHVRAGRTLRAVSIAQLPLGANVRITGGEPKYIGAVGTVVHSSSLRAKVEVPGLRKPVYIYTGEAEPV